jgi:Cellulase (glycosyl hydrolase family 5)
MQTRIVGPALAALLCAPILITCSEDPDRPGGDAAAQDLASRDGPVADGPVVELGLPLDAAPKADAAKKSDTGVAPGGLYTKGNKLYLPGGKVFHGRGANIHDTRSCNACTWSKPDVAEVKRRIDELVSWGANFMRLDLESYASADGRVHYKGVLDDPAYLADVKSIIDHIGTKKGVYVLLSLWIDPTFSSLGWPTAKTIKVWEKLAQTFKDDQHVLFGLCNEPQSNFDGKQDAACHKAMNDAVAAIRKVESAAGVQPHIISVQGTGGWARRMDYYVTHPITAGSGKNIVYEVHVYDPSSDFTKLFINPAKTLPLIIGEFGPHSTRMTTTDCTKLMDEAQKLEIPHLAWTFHMRCPPNLLVDKTNNGCGVKMSLQPTAWGQQLKGRLAKPW